MSELSSTSASQPRVFVTRRLPGSSLERLASVADVSVWPESQPPTMEQLLHHATGCDGLLTLLSDRIDERVLDAAGPGLKVISNYAVGFNNIDIEAAKRRGVRVGNTPDVLTDATADLAVTLLLAASRRVREAAAEVVEGRWKTWEPAGLLGVEPAGQTLGVIGMGRIGKAFAKRMVGGWGMKLIYTSRSDQADIDTSLSARRVEMDELLSQSDFISIHVALCDSTRGLIDREAFSKMKRGVVLINTARGEIVDQDALVEALDGTLDENGSEGARVFAAGLDVTTPEPLSPTHPLVRHERCLILPHIGSATVNSRHAMAEIAVDNVLAGLRGEPLRCPVV